MIVATAGHVDHGKTALVKALTGVDTDRLPQEKARGISIDLGFAYAATPSGRTLGFVDVPGHERFVRNMVAGVCGIDAVLLVVAADDGVMPQTREHLAIVELLGVTTGIVVISKVDAVADARIGEVRREVASLLSATPLAGAPVVEVSSLTGQGIDALRAVLHGMAEQEARSAQALRGFRYAVDRAFSVAGSGTVVTGTVFDGAVKAGDHLFVAPIARPVRVRAIQKAGVAADRAQAGERCALNLVGVEREDAGRGRWIVARHAVTTRFDARLRMLDDAPHPLRHWTAVHLHSGTSDITAHVSIARGASVAPGDSALVQLLCDTPLAARVGDRFIVRDPAAARTLGGGLVIDPFPPERRITRTLRTPQLEAMATLEPAAALEGLLAAMPGGVDLVRFGNAFDLTDDQLGELVPRAGGVVVGRAPPRALAAARVEDVKRAIVAALARFHQETPQAPGMELKCLRRAAAPELGEDAFGAILRGHASELAVEVIGSIARRAQHVATANKADDVLWQRIRPLLLEAGSRGALVRDLAADLRVREPVLADFLHRKTASGEVIAVTAQRFHARDMLARLAALATAMCAELPGQSFVAAQFRDRAGVNRMVAIEILECLDRLGITQRIGDARKIRKDFVPVLGEARAAAPPKPEAPHNAVRRGPPARPAAGR